MGLYKRGNRWYMGYSDEEGRWRNQSTGETDEARAREVYQAMLDLVAHLEAGGVLPITVDEWTPGWLAARRRAGLTVETYERHIRKHVSPHIGHMRLDAVTPRDIKALVPIWSRTLAPATISTVYASVKGLFDEAVAEGYIESSPATLRNRDLPKAKVPVRGSRTRRVLTRGQVERLLAADLPLHRRVFVALLLLTGCRRGEVLGLQWGDIDEDVPGLPRIHVERSEDGPTKTRTPRQVPMHPLLREILHEWRVRGWQEMYGRAPHPSERVIHSPAKSEGGVSTATAWHWWRDALQAAGLPHFRIHDTRRTFITLCRADGARKDVLRDITHGVVRDQIDLYSSLPWETTCEVVEALQIADLRVLEMEQRRAVGDGSAAIGAAGDGVGVEIMSKINEQASGLPEQVVALSRPLATLENQTSGTYNVVPLFQGAPRGNGENPSAAKSAAVAPRLRLAIALLRADRIDEAAAHLCALLDDIEG